MPVYSTAHTTPNESQRISIHTFLYMLLYTDISIKDPIRFVLFDAACLPNLGMCVSVYRVFL